MFMFGLYLKRIKAREGNQESLCTKNLLECFVVQKLVKDYN